MSDKTNHYNLMEFYNNITKTRPLRYGHQFTIEFIGGSLGGLTGYFNPPNEEPVNNITYYVQSSKIPSVEINSAKVAYFSAGFEIPGTVKYPDQWTVEILLGQDLGQYKRLQSWQEAMSNYAYSAGGNKIIPNVQAKVNLLDSYMKNIVKTYMMEGVWIENLSELSFQYQEGSAEIMKCTCTFTMQYWYDLDDGDPLQG